MEYNSNIIPILTGLGQDPMKFSNVGDYQKGLKKAIADIEAKTKGSGDNRSKILRNEFIRIRKTKIDAKKVFNRGSQTQTDSTKKKTTATATPVGGSNAIVKYIENNEQAIGKLTNIVVSDAEDEKKKQKKKKIQTNRENEQKDAKKEEGALEKFKNVGKKALLGPVKAVGKAVKGTLAKLFDFIKIVVGGWFLDKGMKFMQAWEKDDTKTMRKIGMNLIAAVAAVGGVILAMNFGLLALPKLLGMLVLSIVKIGGAILSFLISPPGLIALAIAAGIGGTIFAMKTAVDAGKIKAAGGKRFYDEFQDLKGPLKEAGINVKGSGKSETFHTGQSRGRNKTQKTVDKIGTPEQKEIVANYILKRDRIISIRDNMRDEMEQMKDDANIGRKKNRRGQYTGGAKDIKEDEKEIRAKFESMLDPSEPKIDSKPSDNNINGVIKDNNLSTLDETKPKVTVVKKGSSTTDNTGQNLREGSTTDVPFIASSDSSNFYTMYSKMNYNVVG